MPGADLTQAYASLGRAAAGWGLPLSELQREQIQRYLDDLIDYNRRTNLTAETDPAALLLRHVADGLAAAGALRKTLPQAQPRVLDLGSGGGFIGMAVKIAWPQAHVTLMESVERKHRFLNAAAARSGLKGLSVILKRAGPGPLKSRERGFDAVVERALAPLPQALALALPLARPGGFFLAFQSDPPEPDDAALKIAMALPLARLVKSIPYRLPLESKDRFLALFQKE